MARTRDKTGALAHDRYADTNRWFWLSSSIGSLVLAVYLAAAIPSHGWVPFLVVGMTTLAGPIAQLGRGRRGVAESTYAIGHMAWLIGVGVAAAATGGADSFLLPFLVAFTLGFFSRLSPAAAATYAWSAYSLALVPILVADWDGFVSSPWLMLSCSVGLASVTTFGYQMAAGEIRQRGAATIDQLTGLLNRRGLEERVAELGQQAAVIGDDTPLALVMGDLDHFKNVNDTYGHQRGDDVLRDVAYIIRKSLRRFELAYRMGGEEFLIVLPGHDLEAAGQVAEAVRQGVEQGRPGGVEVTISFGVVACLAARSDLPQLLAAADSALYAAKRAGRNTVVLDPNGGTRSPAT